MVEQRPEDPHIVPEEAETGTNGMGLVVLAFVLPSGERLRFALDPGDARDIAEAMIDLASVAERELS